MSNIGDTWVGAKPFDELLRKFDGVVVGYYENGTTAIETIITCRAPDETTATKLLENIKILYQDDTMHDLSIAGVDALNGRVEREHLNLTYRLELFELPDALLKLIAYFKQTGCTDIQYSFVEING